MHGPESGSTSPGNKIASSKQPHRAPALTMTMAGVFVGLGRWEALVPQVQPSGERPEGVRTVARPVVVRLIQVGLPLFVVLLPIAFQGVHPGLAFLSVEPAPTEHRSYRIYPVQKRQLWGNPEVESQGPGDVLPALPFRNAQIPDV